MSSQTEIMLQYLETHSEELEFLCNLFTFDKRLDQQDLIFQLQFDHFEGYEWLVPLLLVSAENPVLIRTHWRLFLELFGQAFEQCGPRETMEHFLSVLQEEAARFEARRTRLQEMEEQGLL